MLKSSFAALILLLILASFAGAESFSYLPLLITTTPSLSVIITGINDKDQLVGFLSGESAYGFIAGVVPPGIERIIYAGNAYGTMPTGISSTGEIVGETIDIQNPFNRGFVIPPGGGAISDSGAIFPLHSDLPKEFRGISSDGTKIVGSGACGAPVQFSFECSSGNGFLLEDGKITDIAGIPNGVNDKGQVVGNGFLYANGSYTAINGDGLAINNKGQILLTSGILNPDDSFIPVEGNTIAFNDLDQVLTSIDGDYFLATPEAATPEPAMYPVVAIGIISLFLCLKQREKKRHLTERA